MRYRRGRLLSETQTYRRLPALPSRRPGLESYLADVCAVVFGSGLSRRQARWLACRLLHQEEDPIPSHLPLDEDTRRELLTIARDYLTRKA